MTFADVSCTPVAPADPTVTQATCANGEVHGAEITLPTTPGVVYRWSRPELGDGYDGTVTVTVTATVADGFEWGQMPRGWSGSMTTTATFTVSGG